MKVRPWAEFTSDLPEDAIEEGGRFIQWPGKSVTEAIAEMLTGLGYKVSAPIHAHEHGWELNITLGNRRLWAQVTLIDKYLLVLEQNGGGLWPDYLDTLKALNAALANNPRFHDVRWFTNEEVHSGIEGAMSPV